MAQWPPKGYRAEPGAKICGDSWYRDVTATGELPNAGGFGRDMSYGLAPVFKLPDGKFPKTIGWNSTEEVRMREAIRDLIEDMREWKTFYSPPLIGRDNRHLRTLIDQAETYLDLVDDIHDKWIHRKGGSFPLSKGDKRGNFTPLGMYGAEVCEQQDITCPTKRELEQRGRDRKAIRTALRIALRSVRCAEYLMHKTRLQREALAEYEALPPKKRPTGMQFEKYGPDDNFPQKEPGLQKTVPEPVEPIETTFVPPKDEDTQKGAGGGLLLVAGLAAAALLLPRIIR